MLEPDEAIIPRHNPKYKKPSIISCLVSLISVIFTQLSLSVLPLFLPTLSFLYLLPLSAVVLLVVMGLGKLCKRVAGVKASAPAFVFFSICFVWAIYIYVVRQVTSSLLDIVMNIEIIMVLIGLCRIVSLDPGFLTHHSGAYLNVRNSIDEVESQGEVVSTRHRRVRYCRYCKKNVTGFDHHCPAFGNCIAKFQTSREVGEKAIASRNLVVGTMLFCVFQVLWQVVFIMWHVYCACFNIKTDEWVACIIPEVTCVMLES